jgi:hypothetical protein
VRVVPPRPDGACWVRVTCEASCPGCKARGPFGAFTAEGAAECVLCGAAEAPSLFFWRVILKFAHAVGDLAGPNEEGRHPSSDVRIGTVNPYKQVGLETSEASDDESAVRESDDAPSRLHAGPGHPLCPGCAEPIDASWDGSAHPCARCGHAAAGVAPVAAMRTNRSLRAILPYARAIAGKAVPVALECPTCKAPLSVEASANHATCKYCNASVLVPRAPPADSAARPGEVCAWLLFQGPSRKREELAQKLR